MWLKIIITPILIMLVISSCHSKQETNHEEMVGMEGMPPPGYAEVKVDPDRIQLFGVRTEKVTTRKVNKSIRAVGIVSTDERRIANIQTKFSGWVVDLYANFTNQPISKGEPLFSVYSPALLATQEEYIIAKKAMKKRLEGAFASEYSRSNKKLLTSVRKRLELWDIPQEEIERLNQQTSPMKTLTIRSPISGIVLEKNVFTGMNVEPGMTTFVVVDLSHVWILADIFEQDIASIHIGEQATLKLNAYPGKLFEGKVDFINYVVDQTTRTTKIRFDFENSDLLLKPGMYGVVELSVTIGDVLALPEASVIDTGTKKIVFVEKAAGRYMPVEVRLGVKGKGYYQVLDGLYENDVVVTSSQFLMDSESRIQASGGGMEGMMMEMEKK